VSDSWDVIVIGAGAAGLVAGLRAAERGRRVLVVEKNRRAGVKILMSGGTRCNITHDTDNRGIVAAYGPSGKFLHSPLAALSVERTLEMFHGEGVATKVEDGGKIFPVSDKAVDVLAALLGRLERSRATLALGEPVVDLSKEADAFVVATPTRRLVAAKIILTTGGRSYPGSGTTGDGYRFCERFGHTIVPTRPALVPITVNVPWLAELRGLTLPDVGIAILDGPATLVRKRGSLLFAHFGLTGPVALDVSRVVSGHPAPTSLTATIDALPAVAESAFDEWLRAESAASGKKQLAVVLTTHLPRRLADVMLDVAGLARDRKAAALSKDERRRLVRTVKELPLPITGTVGFGRAEVTAGGVALDEVDSRTMVSKLAPNLYLAGEILDLDGPIGGYNFQAAWSTGWLAGSSV
jgi:predicted Rossmann fold flavoprotein